MADAAPDAAIRSSRLDAALARLRKRAAQLQASGKMQVLLCPLVVASRLCSRRHRSPLQPTPFALPTPLDAAVGRHECLRLCRPPPLAGSAYLQSSSIAAPLIQEGYANAMITYFNMNDSSTIGAAYIQGAFIPYINMKDSSSTISYFDDMTSN